MFEEKSKNIQSMTIFRLFLDFVK